ncbi:TPA: hypothetical protein N0F65_002631 [Lagenidium giganteum]|uniref:HSF-type DNA-binding domain-containing protein n=1 Tax=Lagenidium giganteum TaxID=4803 RepID=A0AAV2Z410_9STRA|nr:TPA: hypothetical protein N0F65_002631 [Lagenidium giganteum]
MAAHDSPTKPGVPKSKRVKESSVDPASPDSVVPKGTSSRKEVRVANGNAGVRGQQQPPQQPLQKEANGYVELAPAPTRMKNIVPVVAAKAVAASTTGGGKRTKTEAPKFLLLLYEILETEDNNVIRWAEDGLSLQILDPSIVTDKILPKYFNHTNFHSFQRQLNYFGFRKWTKSKTDICTFSHPYFRQNQPELLQLIKRKKAPRKTAPGDATTQDNAATTNVMVDSHALAATDASMAASATAAAAAAARRLLPLSPSGKRKLPDGSSAGMVVQLVSLSQLNSSALPMQALVNGGGKKKAKKSDKKPAMTATDATNTTAHAPQGEGMNGSVANMAERHPAFAGLPAHLLSAPGELMPVSIADYAKHQSANYGPNGSSSVSPGSSLPTLDIVRNRIIRRQQVGLSPNSAAASNAESFSTSTATFSQQQQVNGANVKAQQTTFAGKRPEEINASIPVVPTANGELSPAFSNSFSDPVDILLRIKKSQSSSEASSVASRAASIAMGMAPTSHDSAQGDARSPSNEQKDSIASLHNFLLGHSLYTNRLESQLKLAMDENETLRKLLDTKNREVESLLNERKMLQNENAVLIEDKNKLFEINRDLLAKLFPAQ